VNPIPFFPQERAESCVPACLRMVLAYYDIQRSEDEIYSCCQTDPDGTLPTAAARCAQSLGLEASALRLPSLEALQERMTTLDVVPIVFVNLAPLLGLNVIHAVIIENTDVATRSVRVLDPSYPPAGRREWTLDLFEVGWRLARYQTILIMRTS
jgi:ABC-type bacteriocin/lantibiotic exporter with double-glycine peptidase domain